MRLRKILSAVPACVCAVGAVSALPSMAQPAGVLKPERVGAVQPKAEGTEERLVRVRNWTAADIAFLLDPEHQPESMLFRVSRENSAAISGDMAKELAEVYPRPVLAPGVSIQKVVEPQNSLLLRGTPQALDAWQEAIKALDKPLQQIDIEVQLVRLSPQALRALGAPTDAPGPHLLAEDAYGKMRELVKGKQAKVVTSPRILCISGLTAKLGSTTAIPARIVPVLDGDDKARSDVAALVPPGRFWIRWGINVAVRPVVRPDAVDMKLAAGILWHIQTEGGSAPVRRVPEVSFRAQDGRSYLLYASPNFAPPAPPAPLKSGAPDGFTPQPAPPQPAQIAEPDAEGQVSVFIVRASVIRRAPTEDQVRDRALMDELIRQGRVEAPR